MTDETEYRLELFKYINKRFDMYYEFFTKMLELNKPSFVPNIFLFISIVSLAVSNIYNAYNIDKLNNKIISMEHHK